MCCGYAENPSSRVLDNAVCDLYAMVPIYKETRAHVNKPVMGCLVPHIIFPDVSLLFMKSKENELESQNWDASRDILSDYTNFKPAGTSLEDT